MKHLFVPYEIAVMAKDAGFNEPCFGLYNLNNGKHEVDIIGKCEYSKEFKYREVLAPLYQQLNDWFREKHKLHIDVFLLKYSYKSTNSYKHRLFLYERNTYYEAYNAALIEAFKLIK